MNSVTDPNQKTTAYSYDGNDRLIGVSKTAGGNAVTNSYTYENDRIKTVTHNGFSYSFNYDSLRNNTAVSVESRDLITNEYDETTGNLLESAYANNQRIDMDYDDLDRVTARYFNGSLRHTYEYDAAGNIGYYNDSANNISFRYAYDMANRLAMAEDSSGNITSK